MEEDWDYWREQLTLTDGKKDSTLNEKVKFVKCRQTPSIVFSDDILLIGPGKPEVSRHQSTAMEAVMLPLPLPSWSLSKALKRVSTSLCFKRSLPVQKAHSSPSEIQQQSHQMPTYEYPVITSSDLRRQRHFDSPQKRALVIKFSPGCLPEESLAVLLPPLSDGSHFMDTPYLITIPLYRSQFNEFLRRRARKPPPRFTKRLMIFEINRIIPIKSYSTITLERPCIHFDRCALADESNILSAWKTATIETEIAQRVGDSELFLIDNDPPTNPKKYKETKETKETTGFSAPSPQIPTLNAPYTIVVSVATLQIPMLLDALLRVSNLIVVERDIPAKIINTSPGHSTLVLDHADTGADCDVPFDSIAIIGNDRDRLLLKALGQWPTCKMLFFESCFHFVSWIITLHVDSQSIAIPEEPTAVS